MKKNISILLSISLFAILMLSCANNKKPSADAVDCSVTNVVVKTVAFDEETMFPTGLILLSDSILVVNEPKLDAGFIKIYNTRSDQQVAELGVIGDGPNDFNHPRFLNDLASQNSFCVGDATKIVRFSVDSLEQKDYSGHKILALPTDMRLYNDVLVMNDSLIIYTQTGEHPISVLNTRSQELRFIDYFPETAWTEETDSFIKNMDVFDNCMTSNGEDIAIAYRNWNTISVITPDGDVKKELHLPEMDYNLGKMHFDASSQTLDFDSEAKIFFTKILSNDKLIFALQWNATKQQVREGEATSVAYVLDWDGNIVRKIVFDRAVSNFCISEDAVSFVTAMGDDGEIHIFKCESQND